MKRHVHTFYSILLCSSMVIGSSLNAMEKKPLFIEMALRNAKYATHIQNKQEPISLQEENKTRSNETQSLLAGAFSTIAGMSFGYIFGSYTFGNNAELTEITDSLPSHMTEKQKHALMGGIASVMLSHNLNQSKISSYNSLAYLFGQAIPLIVFAKKTNAIVAEPKTELMHNQDNPEVEIPHLDSTIPNSN